MQGLEADAIARMCAGRAGANDLPRQAEDGDDEDAADNTSLAATLGGQAVPCSVGAGSKVSRALKRSGGAASAVLQALAGSGGAAPAGSQALAGPVAGIAAVSKGVAASDSAAPICRRLVLYMMFAYKE